MVFFPLHISLDVFALILLLMPQKFRLCLYFQNFYMVIGTANTSITIFIFIFIFLKWEINIIIVKSVTYFCIYFLSNPFLIIIHIFFKIPINVKFPFYTMDVFALILLLMPQKFRLCLYFQNFYMVIGTASTSITISIFF